MSKVPQHLIDEATRRGIVPGAIVSCASSYGIQKGDKGIVLPVSNWIHGGAEGSILVGDNLFGYSSPNKRWATVITPAPSQQPQAIGLQEGDAVECGPAMRAAIIELAKELGVRVNARGGEFGLVVTSGVIVSAHCRLGNDNVITPEAFIAKMRVTAAQPKPITIGGNTVKFTKGEINVGSTTISNETVRAIAAKLIDR